MTFENLKSGRPESEASEQPQAPLVELRPYQTEVIGEFECVVQMGKRRVVLVAPTACGKTIIGAEVIRRPVDRSQNVLVLAHRREIIDQTSRKLTAHGIH